MQNPSGLVERAKTTRAWLRLMRGQGIPASTAERSHPTITGAQQAHPPLKQLPLELAAELNSPPRHRLYSEIMKKHDAIHPRRQ